ncbi:MAG: hypothetical protein JSS63_10970 [Bacteroidetes bacterium]|nr:hypothetical protein [Bacteroidota bacterium]
MKSLKAILGTAALVIIAFAVFSTSNASNNAPSSTSTTCPLRITLGSGSCLSAPYTYCINGGTAMSVATDTFTVYLSVGTTSTICVQNSNNSCRGTLSHYTPSPCPGLSDTTLILSTKGANCSCSND